MSERLAYILQEQVAWQIPSEYEGILNYNPRHDIQDFLNLTTLNEHLGPQEFAQLQAQTISRKRKDLTKMLGERFAVERSKATYYTENNHLKSPDYPGPVVDEWKKGQQFLKDQGSVETEREDAEVKGAESLENIFVKRKLKKDERIIVVSAQGPKGSLYKDNFFDVYEPNGDQIEMNRFHSLHSYEGFLKAARKADPNFEEAIDSELNAAYFLQRPIITTLSQDEILDVFALDPNTQSEKVNEQIVEACMSYILFYIRQLIDNPLDLEEVNKRFNTIPNIADDIESKIKAKSQQEILYKNLAYQQEVEIPGRFANISEGVEFYGRQEVRRVNRGCPGGQRGFSLNQPRALKNLAASIGATSVLDFAPFASPENQDKSDFRCPGRQKDGTPCTFVIRYGSGVRKCPQCGQEATCG